VSRRASSVYQFFHVKEELRTARVSALVVLLAVVCWVPTFAAVAIAAIGECLFKVLLTSILPKETISLIPLTYYISFTQINMLKLLLQKFHNLFYENADITFI